MIDWTFFLDDTEVDEPIGFSDVVIRAKRDDLMHGIFFEASTSDLSFYGTAAAYLVDKKETLGFASDVTFRAVATCGQENDILTGKLDFRKYKRSCGNECLVSIPVEMEGCTMTLRNRYDQKVDLSKTLAFDGTTVLPSYGGLNFEMELAAQHIPVSLNGSVTDDTNDIEYADLTAVDIFAMAIRPTYNNEIDNSIPTGQLIPANNYTQTSDDFPFLPMSPQLLVEYNPICFDGNFDMAFRMKGRLRINTDVTGLNILGMVATWDGEGGDIFSSTSFLVINSQTLGGAENYIADTVIEFDYIFSTSQVLAFGLGLYNFVQVSGFDSVSDTPTVHIEFDPETNVLIEAVRVCPDSDAVVSLIHETASRITEAITDRCLTVKSDYYGRTDSEPYAAAEDGCGSLRVLSSGLRLRNAENPVHFMSLKDLFEGLNPIDNIGMGVEGDQLRIEPVEYFYQDTEIMSMPFVPKAQYSADDTEAYSIIKIGYKKWETEGAKGLDEFNSNKEFRTSLKSISNPIDLTSAFMAGGYPIEQIRQQSFAESGGADTKYDNDTFIICVVRGGYNYQVEQGNIDNGANLFSPATAYNWRIRPFYNLMRWWKSLAQSYANISNTTSKIIFSSGTGNLEAEGELPLGDACKLEALVRAENDDLLRSHFADPPYPLWKPDNIQFTYPMSLRDFNLIKANPYGYISVQCGTGDYIKAFITNLLYKPVKGEADLTLRLKWDIL